MTLHESPFQILGVSVRDARRRIMDAAEASSLQGDSGLIRNARMALLTPRLRLAAEVSWLPGLAPTRATQLAKQAASGDARLLDALDTCREPLAACNVLGAFLASEASGKLPVPIIVRSLREISLRFGQIEPDSVLNRINEDRTVAGIATLEDETVLVDELERHRERLVRCMHVALSRVDAPDTVLTAALSSFTETVVQDAAGDEYAVSEGPSNDIPRLLEDLTGLYQLDVRKDLEQLAEAIARFIDTLAERLEQGNVVAPMLPRYVDQLEVLLREWDAIAQPIQLLGQAQGYEEATSAAVGKRVRSFAVRLWNEFEAPEASKRLADLLATLFAELPEFADLARDDQATLARLMLERQQAKQVADRKREEWEESIALATTIGSNSLTIDGKSLSYDKVSLRLDEITWISWGIFKQYLNGVRVERSFLIRAGSARDSLRVECVRFMDSEATVLERFQTIVKKLWRAVGPRLVVEMLARLAAGEVVFFPGAEFRRVGVTLTAAGGLFRKAETKVVPWSDLEKWDSSGHLWIRSKAHPKASVSISYRDQPNVQVLDGLLDFLFRDGNHLKLVRGEFK